MGLDPDRFLFTPTVLSLLDYQVDYSLELVMHGVERGLEELAPLLGDLRLLNRVVFELEKSVALSAFLAMDSNERLMLFDWLSARHGRGVSQL